MKSIDGPSGVAYSKELCKKAFASKTKKVSMNMFRNAGVDPRTDRPYKWVKSNFVVNKVISEKACIVNPQCGSGLSYRLYSALLYVADIDGAILVDMPKNEALHEEWLNRYNGAFKEYQEYLRPIKND